MTFIQVPTYSQNGEERIILDLLDQYDVPVSKFCVELGAGDGYHLSNTRYFIEHGWSAILIDAEYKGNPEVHTHKINAENINDLLAKYDCPRSFDFLSIDLDGNDYWILTSILTHFSPKLIVAEYNACFDDSRTIKYDSDFSWKGDDYFGFTLEAGRRLAEKIGYEIVAENSNMNIYLLRKDLIKGKEVKHVSQHEINTFFTKSNRTDWVTI